MIADIDTNTIRPAASKFHPRASLFARYKLVTALRRQKHGRSADAAGYQDRHAPADRTQYPRRIQPPAREEPIVVVVQISLRPS